MLLSLLGEVIDQLDGASSSVTQEPSKPTPVCNYCDGLGRRSNHEESRCWKKKKDKRQQGEEELTSPPAILIGHPATLSPLSLCSPTSRSVTKLIGMRNLELPSIWVTSCGSSRTTLQSSLAAGQWRASVWIMIHNRCTASATFQFGVESMATGSMLSFTPPPTFQDWGKIYFPFDAPLSLGQYARFLEKFWLLPKKKKF